jgi:hypothetical protein
MVISLGTLNTYQQTASPDKSVPVSVAELDDLRFKYGNNVECKCKSASVPFKDFTDVSITVNGICSYIPSELNKSRTDPDESGSFCKVMNGYFEKLCVQVDEDCTRAAFLRSQIEKKFESKGALSSGMLSKDQHAEEANATLTEYFDETKLFLITSRYEVDRWAKESMPKLIGIIGAIFLNARCRRKTLFDGSRVGRTC